ncbi:cation transport ATpase [Clostridium aceticum]|uniref:Cation transport ATpase n=1 Tax=Clostridium aceticum TaxID=84022 RepID=A0A0D8IBR4_9CLOT|nr:DUF1097 family protein [Clostridium aceticum]AKL96438.1 cation transport ATpase [Clostridium aceticum]KJF27387.1 hypothetical protein TZ02_08610 [Clostridium aceticum]
MKNRKISKRRMIIGLIVATWLCITLFLLETIGIHSGWPAFLSLMFFTMSGAKTEKLKSIFIGATTGLLMAKILIVGVGILTSRGITAQPAVFIMVFVTVFLLVVLEDLSHTLFNSYSFGYFTVALVPAKQATFEWLIALYLGGAFFIGGVIMLSRYVSKKQASKAMNTEKVKA